MTTASINKQTSTPDLDQTIQKMDDHLERFARNRDRRERFLLMYRTFKNELRRNLQEGRFLDRNWSEAICCRMGEMYFEAMEAYEYNDNCPQSWRICFDSALARETNLLQDALMGMNAHINYDLTVCVYDVMKQYGDFETDLINAVDKKSTSLVDRKLNSLLKKRYFDYLLINQIAWESIPIIQEVLTARFSKILGLLNRVSFQFSRSLVEGLILNYRDRAWTHALLLLSSEDSREQTHIRSFMDDLAVSNTRLIKKFVSYNPLNFIRPALKSQVLERESDKALSPVAAKLLKKKLKQRNTSEYASRTFVEYGSAAVPYLKEMLNDEHISRSLKNQVYRILGKINTPESTELLTNCLDPRHKPPFVLLKAISDQNSRTLRNFLETDDLYDLLGKTLYQHLLTLQISRDLETFPEDCLLNQTLADRRNRQRSYLHLLLKIVQIIRRIPKDQRDVNQHSHYERIVREDLGSEWAALIKAIFHQSERAILEQASNHFQLTSMRAAERIKFLMDQDDEWLKLCIYQLSQSDHTPVQISISTQDLEDPSMLSTVEKVLYLKNVELFNEIPAEELTSIARVAREQSFDKKTPLIEQGKTGRNLYIITEGAVNVNKNGSVVTKLCENDVLGEISLLTESATSADCIAATDTKTLQLNQQDFLDFLYEGYPEIALGLIKVLAQRLEETTARLEGKSV